MHFSIVTRAAAGTAVLAATSAVAVAAGERVLRHVRLVGEADLLGDLGEVGRLHDVAGEEPGRLLLRRLLLVHLLVAELALLRGRHPRLVVGVGAAVARRALEAGLLAVERVVEPRSLRRPEPVHEEARRREQRDRQQREARPPRRWDRDRESGA
jgi:hypothetical protein